MNNKIRISFAIISFLWLAGSILPLFPALYNPIVKLFPFLQILYSPVCHQNSLKFICNDNGCSFICARCVGIYLGVFISSTAAVIGLFKKEVRVKFLFILSIPLLADVLFVSIGLYDYSKIIAFCTGIIFGSAAFYYFYIGIENWLSENKRQV